MVKMTLNMQEKKIKWEANSELIAETSIGDSFADSNLYLFF